MLMSYKQVKISLFLSLFAKIPLWGHLYHSECHVLSPADIHWCYCCSLAWNWKVVALSLISFNDRILFLTPKALRKQMTTFTSEKITKNVLHKLYHIKVSKTRRQTVYILMRELPRLDLHCLLIQLFHFWFFKYQFLLFAHSLIRWANTYMDFFELPVRNDNFPLIECVESVWATSRHDKVFLQQKSFYTTEYINEYPLHSLYNIL